MNINKRIQSNTFSVIKMNMKIVTVKVILMFTVTVNNRIEENQKVKSPLTTVKVEQKKKSI